MTYSILSVSGLGFRVRIRVWSDIVESQIHILIPDPSFPDDPLRVHCRQGSLANNQHSPSTPTPTSSSTAHPSWTHTANLPPPTAYATITPSTSIICPSNNLTLYTPSNGTTLTSSRGKGYLLICGRDYSSLAGAEEITNRQADSIETCIDRCAEVDNCIGAGWGNYEGKQICWLKSRLGNPGWTPDWYMAVREDAVLHDGSEGGLGGDTESG